MPPPKATAWHGERPAFPSIAGQRAMTKRDGGPQRPFLQRIAQREMSEGALAPDIPL